jgi:hypothetical protein
MKIKLKLDDDFIERLSESENPLNLHAAAWVLRGVKPVKRRLNGSAIENIDFKKFDIYKLGYIQAMADLGAPIVYSDYNGKLPTTKEFFGRAMDALGVRT